MRVTLRSGIRLRIRGASEQVPVPVIARDRVGSCRDIAAGKRRPSPGTIVGATIIDVPGSTRNAAQVRDFHQ